MAKPETVEKIAHKDVYAALVAAQRSIEAAAKDSTNAFHKYKYVSADQMIEHCRTALADNGVLVAQCGVDHVGDGWLRISYVAHHADSQTHHSWHQDMPAVTEKGRPIDKAVCGAMTVSLSYAIRGLLLVPREDENEPDRRDDTRHAPQRSAPAPTRTAAAPKPTAPANPKSDHWQPYSDGRDHSADDVLFVAGQVEQVTAKQTAKGNNRYGFRIGQEWFNSFSDTAKECVVSAGKGANLEIGYIETKFGKDIVSIDMQQSAAATTTAGTPDDDLPF